MNVYLLSFRFGLKRCTFVSFLTSEGRVPWSLPDGRVVCWSVAELAKKHNDELFADDVHEAYRAVAIVSRSVNVVSPNVAV